jgi:hypothetical protein
VATAYVLPQAPPDHYAPVLPFDTFMTYVFDWKQNQHIGVIGPTEQGKTNLIYHLLKLRDYVAYLGIKSEDETLDAFAARGGYSRLQDWPPKRGRVMKRTVTAAEMPKRIVWPDARNFDSEAEQRRVFGAAIRDAWAQGRWCVVWDDFWYLVHILGLEKDAKKMLLNARSAHSPQVIAAQRGAGNRMVELFDQPTWLFFARETDPRNLMLIGRPNTLEHGYVANLDRFQFLAKNTRTGVMYRTTAPDLMAA